MALIPTDTDTSSRSCMLLCPVMHLSLWKAKPLQTMYLEQVQEKMMFIKQLAGHRK